jgi:hypothetical protein
MIAAALLLAAAAVVSGNDEILLQDPSFQPFAAAIPAFGSLAVSTPVPCDAIVHALATAARYAITARDDFLARADDDSPPSPLDVHALTSATNDIVDYLILVNATCVAAATTADAVPNLAAWQGKYFPSAQHVATARSRRSPPPTSPAPRRDRRGLQAIAAAIARIAAQGGRAAASSASAAGSAVLRSASSAGSTIASAATSASRSVYRVLSPSLSSINGVARPSSSNLARMSPLSRSAQVTSSSLPRTASTSLSRSSSASSSLLSLSSTSPSVSSRFSTLRQFFRSPRAASARSLSSRTSSASSPSSRSQSFRRGLENVDGAEPSRPGSISRRPRSVPPATPPPVQNLPPSVAKVVGWSALTYGGTDLTFRGIDALISSFQGDALAATVPSMSSLSNLSSTVPAYANDLTLVPRLAASELLDVDRSVAALLTVSSDHLAQSNELELRTRALWDFMHDNSTARTAIAFSSSLSRHAASISSLLTKSLAALTAGSFPLQLLNPALLHSLLIRAEASLRPYELNLVFTDPAHVSSLPAGVVTRPGGLQAVIPVPVLSPRQRFHLCSVLVEDDCDKICDGGWKERPYAWNPVG